MNKSSELLAQHIITFFNGKLNTIALTKLLYLCELESITRFKERFSDFKFTHYKHGPAIFNIYGFLTMLENSHILTIKEDQFVLDKDIEDKEKLEILHTVEEKWAYVKEGIGFGRLSTKNTKNLLRTVYSSEPFIDTRYSEEIKFENYIGKEINKVLITPEEYKEASSFFTKKHESKDDQKFVDYAKKQLEAILSDE